jgi:GNAT superfamily N-acetyltransferase
VRFRDANDSDVEELAALKAAAAVDLTARFGEGHWSKPGPTRIEVPSAHLRTRVGYERGRIATALRLQTRKPWAVDVAYFTAVPRPLYLTGMVVAAGAQGGGRGRAALADAEAVARAWPANAIRLDAYDAPAGAGGFYAKCGYSECGRVRYKGDPLIYYERLLR